MNKDIKIIAPDYNHSGVAAAVLHDMEGLA